MRSSSAFCQEYDDSGVPSVGQDSSTTCPGSAGEYAPTELAATSAGTRVRAIASASRRVPTTFVAHIARTSRAGWMSHDRCTTASAPSMIGARSSTATSASTQSTFGGYHVGRRRATPTTTSTAGSSPRRDRRLVPTLPVAPVTTMRMTAPYPCPGGTMQCG